MPVSYTHLGREDSHEDADDRDNGCGDEDERKEVHNSGNNQDGSETDEEDD